jgi:hypothetical protein
MSLDLGKISGAETVSREVIAYHIVKLYFEEIARLGYKRKLDLDAIIAAYFYVHNKLEDKHLEKMTDKEPEFVKEVEKEMEKELAKEKQ